ncbi:FG-GAP repeat domain-containing protein [Streptomyces sp. NPDC058583]|uniref:FG-GAP repeat domain-containing protein n=1 Tax=unclassified Streptomyces TaxID=2593676 RepID=UPI00364AF19E
MHVMRTRGRRFAAVAVTVTLAATGGMLTAFPATAAAAVSGAMQEAGSTTVPFPRGADIIGAGPSGFLSQTRGATPEFRWTWYADGSSVVLPGATTAAAGGKDLVVTVDRSAPVAGRVLKVYDLSKPAAVAPAPQEVELDALGDGYFFEGLAGNTLLLGQYQEGGPIKQYAATLDGGMPKPRWVAGSPGFDCHAGREGWTDTGSALYECHLKDTGSDVKVLVDFAASDSTRWYAQGWDESAREGAVSGTHVAWREARISGSSTTGIVAHKIGAPGEEVWLPSDDDMNDPVYLVGGWVASGQKAHIDASGGAAADTVRPFTLQSIATGEKSVALTAFSSAVAGPAGTLLVRGGTPEHGEGLYRISPRADGGRPDVELVASTGQSTVVTLTGSSTPTTLTGEQVARGVDFTWDLSRADSRVWLTLTHVRSRQTVYQGWPVPEVVAAGTPRRFTWHWDGKDLEGRDWGSPAANGAYEWKLTARPDEGIGPELVSTGRFTVTRPTAAHDYNDDGTADLLVRDAADGVLWRFGTRPTAPGGSLTDTGATRVGSGWGSYDQLVSVGNVAGGSESDSVARDRSGALWLYRGTGDRNAPLAARTLIGRGWQVYDRITGGSDLTGDGRADLVATDRAGDLYLYKGTGSATAPFATRKKIGVGWGIYNQLTATGNLAGGPAGDLVARDKAGVLWLYLGKGDGTFAARSRIGTGWGTFTGLTAVGDANGDGRADLVAWNGDETFYAGTGDWKAPFKPGARVSLTQDSFYNAAF